MASELVVLPTSFRRQINEDQIRHSLAYVIDVFEDKGDIPLTIVTGSADQSGKFVIEVGFEVSESGNVLVYHAMEARQKYRWSRTRSRPESGRQQCHDRQPTSSVTPRNSPTLWSPMT